MARRCAMRTAIAAWLVRCGRSSAVVCAAALRVVMAVSVTTAVASTRGLVVLLRIRCELRPVCQTGDNVNLPSCCCHRPTRCRGDCLSRLLGSNLHGLTNHHLHGPRTNQSHRVLTGCCGSAFLHRAMSPQVARQGCWNRRHGRHCHWRIACHLQGVSLQADPSGFRCRLHYCCACFHR